ncbi:uncharacterized protein LOC143258970 [Megalopta genalis]|uniref:uncharacterized protein LOC143258970 n=1 Tax=Megalopta genalis TaxID=115081 RepID=UPI003FD6824C
MSSTESRKRKREEYEMQLFGFHSRSVYATIQDLIVKRICDTAEKLCVTIEKKYKLDSENVELLKKIQKKLKRACCKGALLHLKTVENIINKSVAVPSNILLDEDKCQRRQYTDAEFNSIKDKLEDLQRKAKRASVLNATLKEELQISEKYQISEDSVNEMFKIVETGLTCSDISNEAYQLVDDYKQFSTNLCSAISISEKLKHNMIDNLKCKEIDFNSL